VEAPKMKSESRSDTVERLYQRLAQALQRTRRDAFAGPVTVAEIYQELVPYRAVRGEAGFDMNADYEHALLRLLAGEGALARLEPAHAREQITKELRSPNPNVSIYREYAGCDVFVSVPAAGRRDDPAALLSDVLADDDADASPWDDLLLLDAEEEDAEEDDAEEDDAPAFALADQEPEPKAQEKRQVPPTPPRALDRPIPKPTPAPAMTAAEPDGKATRRCANCDGALPSNRSVRFCPYCGQDQSVAPCASCGEPMEAAWTYCVACGATRGEP
jgi:hypothetical protein